MPALYQFPPNPTGFELAGIIDRALEKGQAARDLLGGAMEFTLWQKATGSLARLFQADYNAGANRQLDGAMALLHAARDEANATGYQRASGELIAKVRQACITIEQEAGGSADITTNNIENRAALTDDLTDPANYVGAAVGGFAPAAAAGASQLELPKNPLAGLKTWVYVVGGLVVVAIIVGIYLRVRGK